MFTWLGWSSGAREREGVLILFLEGDNGADGAVAL